MTTLYLIRHGTTDSNLAGVFQGKLDTSLNERGMEQARLLAQRFAGVHLDRVYVSALQRARQTAQLLCGQTGAPCTILPALNEIDLGQLEGQSKSGWGQFPEAIRQFEKDVAHFQAPGGESTRQVYETDGESHRPDRWGKPRRDCSGRLPWVHHTDLFEQSPRPPL